MKSRSGLAVTPPADGFTIVEVLVAITVLVIAMLGAALLFENAIIASGNTRNRVVAANLATAQMESVRGQAADPTKFSSIPGNEMVFNPVVNGITFTVTQEIAFVDQNSTLGSCDAGNPTTRQQIMQVTERVTWPSMGGTQPVSEATTLAPPVGAYSSTAGSIAAKVVNAAGQPSENINVQIVGPTSAPVTKTGQTSADGCAYFAFIAPGMYTVTVIENTGVGDQEVALPAQTASVTVGQTTPLQFAYDFPAKITVTLPSPTNLAGAPPHASNLSISVGNTGLQPYRQFSFSASAVGDVTTSPGLFPYTSGYTVFAGNCTDNNPVGRNSSGADFYPVATYPTAAPLPTTVTPGGNPATTVILYPLAVHVANGAGVPVAAATTTAVETSSFPAPNGAVCTSGTANTTPPTLGLVATNATGDSLTSVPLGHWTIKAVSGPNVNVWVKPDGVYSVNASGVATTKYAGPITVVTS